MTCKCIGQQQQQEQQQQQQRHGLSGTMVMPWVMFQLIQKR
jgi:hypothetical protein